MRRRTRIRVSAAAGAAALTLTGGHALVVADSAAADDSVPTAWMEAARTTPLLHAPPPPSPATICLIDTGVTPTPDLNIVGRSAADGGTLDDVRANADSPGHGTAVAHMAAGAVNGWGGAGVFPHARITSVRVFPRDGGALWQEYVNGLQACHRLAPTTTKVVLMSLGGQTISAGEVQELGSAIEKQREEKDFSVVVAAGNGGADADFPGRFDSSFTVGGSDSAGALCAFSARGPGVDIAAPGCGLAQAGWDGTPWLLSGTSHAAPIAAGVLAALRAYRPTLSATAAETILTNSSRPGAVPLMDATAALEAASLETIISAGRPTPDIATPSENSAPNPPGAPTASVPPVAELTLGKAHRKRRSLGKPRISVGPTRRGRTTLWIRNRLPGALVEIRAGRRTLKARGSRVSISSRLADRARVRFVTPLRYSQWVYLRTLR